MTETLWDKLDRYTRLSRLAYPVPEHGRRLPYILGGLTFMGFLILVGSGLLIAQFYNPAAPKTAYDSVKALQASPLGYVRSVHLWIANATVLTLIAHLLRVFWTGAYKFPRQLTWWIGVGLFGSMVFGSYFSGTVLKWDGEGAEAAEHYKVTLRYFGPIGELMLDERKGNSPFTIRMYLSHIALFPLVTVALLVGHFYLIRVFNLAPTPKGPYAAAGEIPRESMGGKFYHHGSAILLYGALYYGLAAVLALMFPAELGGRPTGAHSGEKPAWVFLWLYGLENIFGVKAVLAGNGLLFLFLFLVPFLDRGADRAMARRRIPLWIGAMAFSAVVLLSTYAWVAPPQVHEGIGEHTHGNDDEHDHEEEMHDGDGDRIDTPTLGNEDEAPHDHPHDDDDH